MPSDMSEGSLSKLLELVEQECTAKTVHGLLTSAKSTDPTVKLSEANKKALIHKNLRSAIERNAIPPAKVYEVLCAAEENGGQHIFYYLPLDVKVKLGYDKGEEIAEKLFGKDWRKSRKFPQFHLQPKGVLWSDFRIVNGREPAQSEWAGKVYAGMYRREFIEEIAESETRVKRIYEINLSREIYLVRWRHFGLLELRVPRQESKADVLEAVEDFWGQIKGGVNRDDFIPWDLSKASAKMMAERKTNEKMYRRGNARALNKSKGSVYFSAASSDDDLCDDAAHAKAVGLYSDYKEVVIQWLPQAHTDALDDELRTVIGKMAAHEILISAKTTAAAVDYVTFRLRDFAS